MASASFTGIRCLVGGAAHCSWRTSGTSAYYGYNASGAWVTELKFSATVGTNEKITSINVGMNCWADSNYVYAAVSSNETDSTYKGATGSKSGATYVYLSASTSGTWNDFTVDCSITSSGTYYVYIWPATTSPQWQASVYGSGFASVGVNNYVTKVTVSFAAGSGSGSVPSSLSGYAGDYVTCSSTKPTVPSSSSSSSNITATCMNGTATFGTHKGTKTITTSYKFRDWYNSTIGSVSSGGGFYLPSSSCTLTARYTSSQSTTYSNNKISNVKSSVGTPSKTGSTTNITITLDASTNGGTTSTASVNATKKGVYTFLGWHTSSTSTSALADTTTFTANITYYAIYSYSTSYGAATLPTTGVSKSPTTSNTYTVTLNAGDGSVSPTSVKAYKKKEYSFLGWATSSTGTSYITSYTPTSDSAVTLYAIFDSGTTKNYPVDLPSATLSNGTFVGWSTTSGSTTSNVSSTGYMPSSNITLYAVYTIDEEDRVEAYVYTSASGWVRIAPSIVIDGVVKDCITNGGV